MSGLSKKNIETSLKFVYSDNNSLSVIFHDNDLLMGVVGEFNKNLKELEKITGSSLYSRGNSILIKSNPQKNEIVKNAIQFLANQYVNNGSIENKDIVSSVDKFMINEKVKNNNVTDIIKTPKKSIIPRSEKQKDYVRALRQSDIIISAGPAGTGKTFLAVAVGLTMLLEKKIERIILSRPAVEAGERLGFLPGDLREKIDPYLRPLYDALEDMLDQEKLNLNLQKNIIEIAPLAYMRGRTLNNAFVILDEAQNATNIQMKMFLTRIGFNSRAIITGDVTQTDLPRKQESGLISIPRILNDVDGIDFVYLDEGDVVRHKLVKDIINAYDRYIPEEASPVSEKRSASKKSND